MPRGTRAIHDVSIFLDSSHRGHDAMLAERHLVASCWCGHGFVRIHRSDLLECNTGVCGLPGCRPPGDRMPAEGVPVRLSGATWIATATGKRLPDFKPLDDVLIRKARELWAAYRGAQGHTSIPVRRDLVAALFEQGLHAFDIAVRLEVSASTVNADLTWWRCHGRNWPRYQRRPKGVRS